MGDKKILKSSLIIATTAATAFSFLPKVPVNAAEVEELKPTISYRTHVQNIGWQDSVKNGEVAGTSGKSLRVEALKIDYEGPKDVKITYNAHVQNEGWTGYIEQGKIAGSVGKSQRVEAIKIKAEGLEEKGYEIKYRAHVQNIGWQDWVKANTNDYAGTEGQSLRIEAIQIKVEKITELSKAKDTAIADLEKFVDPADYTMNSKELEDAIKAGKDAINKASTEADVQKALEDAKAAISEIKTDEEMKATFDARKADAVAALESYVDAANYEKYNKETLADTIEVAKELVNGAQDDADLTEKVEQAHALIDAILTDKEVEELNAAKEDAKEQLNTFIEEAKALDEKYSVKEEEEAGLKESGEAIIDEAEAVEDVENKLADAKKVVLDAVRAKVDTLLEEVWNNGAEKTLDSDEGIAKILPEEFYQTAKEAIASAEDFDTMIEAYTTALTKRLTKEQNNLNKAIEDALKTIEEYEGGAENFTTNKAEYDLAVAKAKAGLAKQTDIAEIAKIVKTFKEEVSAITSDEEIAAQDLKTAVEAGATVVPCDAEEEYLGKKVSELQDGLSVDTDKKIKGKSLYVAKFEGFGTTDNGKGNYIALKIGNTDKRVTKTEFQIDDGTAKEITDGYLILKVNEESKSKTLKITYYVEEEKVTTLEYKLSDLEIETEDQRKEAIKGEIEATAVLEPCESTEEVLGKSVSELQRDLTLEEAEGKKIKGTSLYVENFEGFSGSADGQKGNYIAVKISNTDERVTKIGAVFTEPREAEIGDDGILVVKVTADNKTTQDLKVKFYIDGYEEAIATVSYDLDELEIKDEEGTKLLKAVEEKIAELEKHVEELKATKTYEENGNKLQDTLEAQIDEIKKATDAEEDLNSKYETATGAIDAIEDDETLAEARKSAIETTLKEYIDGNLNVNIPGTEDTQYKDQKALTDAIAEKVNEKIAPESNVHSKAEITEAVGEEKLKPIVVEELKAYIKDLLKKYENEETVDGKFMTNDDYAAIDSSLTGEDVSAVSGAYNTILNDKVKDLSEYITEKANELKAEYNGSDSVNGLDKEIKDTDKEEDKKYKDEETTIKPAIEGIEEKLSKATTKKEVDEMINTVKADMITTVRNYILGLLDAAYECGFDAEDEKYFAAQDYTDAKKNVNSALNIQDIIQAYNDGMTKRTDAAV